MRFNRPVILTLLWTIFLACLFPLTGAAQSAKIQEQMRKELTAAEEDIKNLKAQLAGDDRKIEALQANPPPTEEQKAYLKDINSANDKIGEKTIGFTGQLVNLANNYFQIFLGVFVILGAIGAFVVFLIQKGAEAVILTKAKRSLEKEINERVHYESFLTLASVYSRLGVTWYEYYEPQFQRYKHEKNGARPLAGACPDPSEVMHEINMARHLSDQGLQIYNERLDDVRKKSDQRAWHTYARLMNQDTYHLAAMALFRGWDSKPQDPFRKEALKSAEICLKLSDDERATGDLWYNLRESAAFAMVALGDAWYQKIGQDCLRDLLNPQPTKKKPPIPDEEWRQSLLKEYFPLQNGSRINPYGLDPTLMALIK